jgi:hypothetical protein
VPGAIELDSKRERPFGRSARDACHAGAGSLVDSGTLPTLDASRPGRHEASRDGSVCDCGSGPRSDLGAGWLEKLQEKVCTKDQFFRQECQEGASGAKVL